ncbi:STAS domain-containing protein [Pedobacter faecalis]|uniref:STAS domain-containing protein n=1 Tax=Pedobacter faecalis TaxID=3041495 RepID=UPI002550CCF5|nr:STAS domain-containing protein [Pedobacter sp. ELA7]
MEFSLDRHDKYVVLKLHEPALTNDNTPRLKSEVIALNSQGYSNIVLDLSAVKHCDDAQDLSCLLAGDRLCKKQNGLFIVTGLNENLSSIVQLSNLDESLTIVGRMEEAEDLIFMNEIERELLGGRDTDDEV